MCVHILVHAGAEIGSRDTQEEEESGRLHGFGGREGLDFMVGYEGWFGLNGLVGGGGGIGGMGY